MDLALQIIIFVSQTIGSCYQIFYLNKFCKNKVHYPLKQLSPKITIHQGIFLILSQFTLLIELSMFLKISKTSQNHVIDSLIAFLYIFSRGCCFSFALCKTARIILAFDKNQLNPQSYLTKYFSSEKIILLFGYAYSFIGFPLVSFITTYFALQNFDQFCWLDNYHNNKQYIMINSLLEEGLCIYLMFYIIFFHLEDKLYKLTFYVLWYYMGWFIITCLILTLYNKITNKKENEDEIDIINSIVTFSFLVRAYLMFYLYVKQPINYIEMHPTLYINSNQIQTFDQISSLKFQGHFQDSIILQNFEDYLKYLDQQNKNKLNQLFQSEITFHQFSQHQLYKIKIGLSKLLNQPAPMNIIEDYLVKEFNNHEILNQLGNQPENLEQHLNKYLSIIYQNGFKNTCAYNTIKNYYDTQKIAVKNLETLGMKLIEYDPLIE